MQHPTPGPSRRLLDEIATTFDEARPQPPLSPTEIDILLKEYAQNVGLATNAEGHRSSVMAFIFAGIGALTYALAAVKFSPHYWLVAMAVGFLGAFAALLSNIYHERWMFYTMLARGYRWRIAAANPAARLEEIRGAAKTAHQEEFRRRVPLYAAWQWLGIGISFSGFAEAAMMIAAVIKSSK